MKCRTFKIDLSGKTNNFAEMQFNKFLEKVVVRQTFAKIVGDDYWSILVLYDDAENSVRENKSVAAIENDESVNRTPKSQAEKPAAEPIVLTPDAEEKFVALKNWRNARAAEDGVPPYLIAHNEALMQIAAAAPIENVEDLTNVKGFGEKRALKYGEEILRILSE